jgi:hypothetical protein
MDFNISQLEREHTFVFTIVTKDAYMDFFQIMLKCYCSQFGVRGVTVVADFGCHIASLFNTEQPRK